jgi:hypothetical protein
MFGSDFAGVESIDWNMSFRSGEAEERIAAQEAIARRFCQESGSLFYAESYGLDLRSFLVDVVPPAVAKSMIVSEALQDERCIDCQVEITIREDSSWLIEISPVLSDGTSFNLTFVVSADNAERVKAQS